MHGENDHFPLHKKAANIQALKNKSLKRLEKLWTRTKH